jgi:hypothetical protein
MFNVSFQIEYKEYTWLQEYKGYTWLHQNKDYTAVHSAIKKPIQKRTSSFLITLKK